MTHGAARREDESGGFAEPPDDGLREGRPLWRQRDFGIFWAAQTLSVLGDSFALIALPLLVLRAEQPHQRDGPVQAHAQQVAGDGLRPARRGGPVHPGPRRGPDRQPLMPL